MLIAAQRRLGNSWTRIAADIPGRRCAKLPLVLLYAFIVSYLLHSENEVKNRWYSAAIRNKHTVSNTPKRRLVDVVAAAGTRHAPRLLALTVTPLPVFQCRGRTSAAI
jgi:hypothetical protein